MTKRIETAIAAGTIEDKIAKLEAHKKAIEAKIAECQDAWERSKKPKLAIPFVPEEGEKYWLYASGYYIETPNDKTGGDFDRIKEGNTFRTNEEAKLAYEKRCAEAELLRMCDGLDIIENGIVIVPQFCRDDKLWVATEWYVAIACPYRFASRESCKAAINTLGDRKLRLIFNIPLED